MDYHVDRITLDPQPVAVVSGTVPQDGIAEFLARAFREVLDELVDQGVPPDGPLLARYEMAGDGFTIEAGAPVAEEVQASGRVHTVELPGGLALTVLHRGPYAEVVGAYRAAEAWMAEHDWSATGAPWEVYLDDPETTSPRTLVHWPARPN